MSDPLRECALLLRQRQIADAQRLVEGVLSAAPRRAEAWLVYAQVELQRGGFPAMLMCLDRALATAPTPEVRLQHAHALMSCGRSAEAIQAWRMLERECVHDHLMQAQLAEAYTHAGKHEWAQGCYRRALAASPRHPGHLFNYAGSLVASGDFLQAEGLLNALLEQQPDDHEARLLLSNLRRQTSGDHHVEVLKERLQRCDEAGEIPLCFALAKELEDLGEYAESFIYLQRGASKRRERLSYRVQGDVDAMRRIEAVYGAAFLHEQRAKRDDDHSAPQPIFITGLPRSGTTLLDRIVSSHSRVASLGEINDLALAVARLAGGADKSSTIERSALMNFAALGREYLDSARGRELTGVYFIDKTPLNFLYLALVHLALPHARVLHLMRDPMDACFGMYKTLFRMGYPFSYDFADLAQYYAAYQRLMNHWRRVLPSGAFLDVSYEDLVDNQEHATRRILQFCGLQFEPQCLEFHRNAAPVATASAVQVRRPINRDAIGRWRRYERELQPLREALRRAGVEIS